LAEADILDIWDHIAEHSIKQADRWVDKLDEKFSFIAAQPLMGRARDELAANVRSFPFGRYVIFYEPIGSLSELSGMLVCSAMPQLTMAVHSKTPMTAKHQITRRELWRLRRFLDERLRGCAGECEGGVSATTAIIS